MESIKTKPVAVKSAEGQQETNRFFHASMLIGGSRFVSLGLGFVVNLLLVRLLTKPDLALYLLFVQTINSAVMVAHLGLDAATLRFVPLCQAATDRDRLFRLLVTIQVAMLAVVSVSLLASWSPIAAQVDALPLQREGVILIIAVVCMSLNRLLDAYLRSQRHFMTSAVAAELLPRLINVIAFAGLLYAALDAPLPRTIRVFATAHAVCLGVYLWSFWKTKPFQPKDIGGRAYQPPRLREVLETTVSLGARNGVSIFMQASDIWIVALFATKDDVATYGIALAMLQLVAAIPAVANQLIPQEFSVYFANGQLDKLESIARTSATLVSFMTLALVVGFSLFGLPLIGFVFGSQYQSSLPILLILMIGSVFNAGSGSAGFILQMTGDHVRLLRLNVVAAVINLVLSLGLGYFFEGIGVAVATSTSLIFVNILMVFSVYKRLGVKSFCYTTLAGFRNVVNAVLRLRGA